MDQNQYLRVEPLTEEELLSQLAEYQRDADDAETELEELKGQAKQAKDLQTRARRKIQLIAHSVDSGEPLYYLKGGEITLEHPDKDGSLAFSEPEEAEEEEEIEPGQVEVVEEDDADVYVEL